MNDMDNHEKKVKNKRKKRVKKKKKLSGDSPTDTTNTNSSPDADAGPRASKEDGHAKTKTAATVSYHDTPKSKSSSRPSHGHDHGRGPSPSNDKLQHKQEQPSKSKKRKSNKDPKNNTPIPQPAPVAAPLPTKAEAEKEGNDNDNRPPRYSFQVDDTDHCETPIQAYKDVLPVLDRIAKSLNKKRSNLIIYDPYYCDGGVKKKLFSYGFTSVINRNRDFYDDIAKKETPEYDVLVTNPPYSGEHMEKLLDFCNSEVARSNKPFLLLLPHFVYTKDYYQRALSSNSADIFFLVPEIRYSYFPPAWVEAKTGSKAIEQGRIKTAPFPSFWYLFMPQRIIHPKWLVENFGPSGSVRPKHRSKLRYANCTQHIPRDFRGEFDPNKKRANPKARKRAAKRRYDAMKAASGGLA